MTLTTQQGARSSTFRPPSPESELTLVDIFDYNFDRNGDHELFRYEKAVGDSEICTITWATAVDAMRTIARSILRSFSLNPDRRPVIAILAVSDSITYYLTIAGIFSSGCVAFPISVRNSKEAVAHLLHSTNVKHMLVSQDPAMQGLCEAALQILKERPDFKSIAKHPMPVYEDIFRERVVERPDIVQPTLDSNALILHSSGSTSFPKPITFTFRTLKESGVLPYYGEMDICDHVIAAHAVPMFHLMGAVQIAWTAYTGVIMAVFRPGLPPIFPSPNRVFSDAMATKSTLMFCVPTFLEAWAQDESCIDALSKLAAVIYAGGPLQPTVGDMLAKRGVHLTPLYGQTETGTVTLFIPKLPQSQWDYWRFSPHCTPVFEPYESSERVFRLLFKVNSNHHPTVLNTEIDGLPGLDTNDLIAKHPKHPDLWRVYGRADDQIMHSTGEKTNPVPLEAIISKDPRIESALMFGRSRFHAGVIVTPKSNETFSSDNSDFLAQFRNSIWETIEKANRYSPQHSRIFKEMIIVARPEKPFEYTPKGTPRRQAVLDAYATEIIAAYDAVAESSQSQLIPPLEWNRSSTLNFVRKAVKKVMSTSNIGDQEDLFQNGCDSLQATWIRNTIIQALRSSKTIDARRIPQNLVYSFPTLSLLADYLIQVVADLTYTHTQGKDQTNMMDKMARYYLNQISITRRPVQTNLSEDGEVVLLTGSTGAFGSYILDSLARMARVAKIYALGRRPAEDSRLKLSKSFDRKGLDFDAIHPKVVFIEGKLHSEKLDLSNNMYEELQASVTCIIHNAWQVDFNVALKTLEPLVLGTKNLVDLALSCQTVPRFEFVSSAGVFQTPSSPCKEEAVEDPSVSVGMGYSESKWVAETILNQMSMREELKPVIVRVGQLSGARRNNSGAWNTTEWFPTLVKSSQKIGLLPNLRGVVSWIPIDIAAQAIVDICFSQPVQSIQQAQYVHLVHPRPVRAALLMEPLSTLLNIPQTSFAEWMSRIEVDAEDVAETSSNASANPALRLIDFFRSLNLKLMSKDSDDREVFGFPKVIAEKAILMAKSTLADEALEPLSVADVRDWIGYWRKEHFID